MGRKRKADCSPEEWEKLLAYDRWYRATKGLSAASKAKVKERMTAYYQTEEYKAKKRVRDRKRWAELDAEKKAARLAQQSEYRKTPEGRTRCRIKNRRQSRAKSPVLKNPRNSQKIFRSILDLIKDQEARFDIASEAMLAFMSGEALSLEEAVTLGRKRHYRMFTKFSPVVSLDEVTGAGLSRHELIAAPGMGEFGYG